jgi:uncharacterized protein involved in exopolysaccharide biosynthesis
MNLQTQDQNTQDELDLPALVQIVWRRRWLVGIITAIAGAIAVAIALLTDPVFRAQVVVTEVRENSGIGGAAGSLIGQLGGLASMAGLNVSASDSDARSNQAVLKSRNLVEEFVRRNKLADEMFRKSTIKPTLWRAVEAFRGGVLTISDDIRQGKTTVSVEWTDPKLAADWANGYVALANETLRTRALAEATRNVTYLNEQLQKTTQVERQRMLYALMENENKTLMLANARMEFAFRVVDPAVAPELRVRPARTLMVLTGGALGFSFGVFIVILLNYIARTRQRLARSRS